MKETDRGIIKWQPFNSCFNADTIIKEIETNKNRISFPSLSDDQIANISKTILEAYNLKLIVNIDYYFDGNGYMVTDKINYNQILKIISF